MAPVVTILYKDYLRFHLAWIASASREYPQIYKSPFVSMVRIIVFVIEGTFLVERGGGGGLGGGGEVFSKFLALPLPVMDWFIYKQTLKIHLTLAHPFNTNQAEVIITNRIN